MERARKYTNRLIHLFERMSQLTSPECAHNCRAPHSCCSPEYCDMAEEAMKEAGTIVLRTNHPTLKYMGPDGCIVPPHFRPLCTFHVCCINNIGFKPNDPLWTRRYFDLRNKIEEELHKSRKS